MTLVADSSTCVTVSWTPPLQINVCQPQTYQVRYDNNSYKVIVISSCLQYRCTSNSWLATSDSDATSQQVCSLEPDTEVTCYVRAQVQDIWTAAAQSTVTTPCTSKTSSLYHLTVKLILQTHTEPSAPVNVQLPEVSQSCLTLEWNAATAHLNCPLTGYQVFDLSPC